MKSQQRSGIGTGDALFAPVVPFIGTLGDVGSTHGVSPGFEGNTSPMGNGVPRMGRLMLFGSGQLPVPQGQETPKFSQHPSY
ncbi:MAG: hypothetical protein JAZ11_02975 [Candidatus Thiodiazotropha lotti]|nr:hypothetical protein [Candidatus Thiodiazotropha lotti]